MNYLKNSNISRRSVLKVFAGAAALTVPLDVWLSENAAAQTSRVRYDLISPEGKRMLVLYEKAVGLMNARPAHDPLSWRFQANIHAYPQNEPVNATFALPNGATPEERAAIAKHRELALGDSNFPRTWRTCSHAGYPEHFLTWHRLYTYFFERIVEKIVGEPFTLPYWNYQDRAQRRIPEAFRNPRIEGRRNWLWFAARNDDPDFLRDGLLDEDVDISQAQREERLLAIGSRQGFSAVLEQIPHNQIHGAVGGGTNGMGQVPFAARDPIFWVHHANIDRIWESWRRANDAGHSPFDPQPPSNWHNRKFAFVGPDGERVMVDAPEALNISVDAFKYKYDRLIEFPTLVGFADQPETPPTQLSGNHARDMPVLRSKGEPVTVKMKPSVPESVVLGFGAQPSSRYELIVEVKASTETNVFDVFMNLPVQPGSRELQERKIGTFSLFGTQHEGHDHDTHQGGSGTVSRRFDITRLVREKLIDPAKDNNVTLKVRYESGPVNVQIVKVTIQAK